MKKYWCSFVFYGVVREEKWFQFGLNIGTTIVQKQDDLALIIGGGEHV